MTRQFTDQIATRERVPINLGIMGPSGSGKTCSALRLATGMQRVIGGEIFLVDTESRRSLEYANEFRFRHVPFDAPFGSLDYLAAFDHCKQRGASIIITDSMSHEHEGPGGLLEQHANESERLVKQWDSTPDKVKMSAWVTPKAARRRLINSLVQLGINFIGCFRAKEKIQPKSGGKPENLGWMPIAGPEFIYEMQACALLYPGCEGRPIWRPTERGEKQMVKLPGFAREMFSPQLDESTGERLARWALGDTAPANETASQPELPLIAELRNARDQLEVEELEDEARKVWDTCDGSTRNALNDAGREARNRLGLFDPREDLTA